MVDYNDKGYLDALYTVCGLKHLTHHHFNYRAAFDL